MYPAVLFRIFPSLFMISIGCSVVAHEKGLGIYQGWMMCVSGLILLTLSFLRNDHRLLLWTMAIFVVFQSFVLAGFGCIKSNLVGFPLVAFMLYIPAYQVKTVTPWLEKIIFQKEIRAKIVRLLEKIFK